MDALNFMCMALQKYETSKAACTMVSTDMKLGNPFVVSGYIFLSFV